MCYAAYTKGTTALLTAILALAETSGVRTELSAQWERDEPGFSEQAERRARRVTAKAWRFAGEMDEIASTFESARLPRWLPPRSGRCLSVDWQAFQGGRRTPRVGSRVEMPSEKLI